MDKYYVYCLLDPQKEGKFDYGEVCFFNEPFYIGKGSGRRIKAHFYPSNLNVSNYKNNKIKNIFSLDKYPIVQILFDNLREDIAYEIEKNLVSTIGRFNIKKGPLSNLTDGGQGSLNLTIPKKRKKVYQFSLDSVFLSEYDSLTEASQKSNLFLSDISNCCRGKSNTHGGYFWSFKKTNNNFIKNRKFREIIQFSLEGEIINKFESIKQAALFNSLSHSKISNCCSGKLLKIKDSYFRYSDIIFPLEVKNIRSRVVLKISLNELVEFESVKKASDCLNISTKNIIKRCKNLELYDDLYLIYKDDYLRGIRKKFQTKNNNQKKVRKLSSDGIILKNYTSISEAANLEGISRGFLSRILKNKKMFRNFKFEYIDI